MESFSEWIFKVLAIFRETTTCLAHRKHQVAVVSWSDEELWVGGKSFFDILLIHIWKTSRIWLCPFGSESYTSPIFREVTVEEQGAHAIMPIVIMHQERSVISIKFKLLIWRESSNVLENDLFVFFYFRRFFRPSSKPFWISPRVSQAEETKWVLVLSIIWVIELHDIINTVGVIQDETSWASVNNLRTFLAITFNAATKETTISFSI